MRAHAGEPPLKPGRGVSVGVVSKSTEGVVRAPEQSVHSHIPRQKLEQGSTEAAIVLQFVL